MLLDIKAYWGIKGEPAATTPTTWDVAGKYILKLVKADSYAQSNVRLSEALRADGVPVSHILLTKAGRAYAAFTPGCRSSKFTGICIMAICCLKEQH
jgi:hypothetical protein